jgi:hypothetical protein
MQAACPQELHVRRDDRMNKIKQGASGLPLERHVSLLWTMNKIKQDASGLPAGASRLPLP